MIRRGYSWVVFLFAGLTCLSCTRAPKPITPPVVMIMIDTLRADYLGAYGFQGDISPNIDGLARQGVVFERCFSQSPWTKPSVATLLTGLYPSVHKVYTEEGKFHGRAIEGRATDALSKDATTLAEVLASRGYTNAAFVANPWIRAAHGFDQGFSRFDTEGADNDQLATVLVDRAKRWLDERQPGEPFFLYVHLMDVHAPYDAPQEDFEAVRRSPSLGSSQPLQGELLARIPPYMKLPAWTKTEEGKDVLGWRGHYAAGVRFTDRAIGDLLAHLRLLGVFDSSLVIVTSDHGEELNDHGRWDHGYRVYDHQIHVPLVVRYPQGAAAGTRVKSVSRLVDVMPTVLATVGAPIPSLLQGSDLTPLLRGEDEQRISVTEAVKWAPDLRAVRSTTHKLVYTPLASQLFDFTKDPRELSDVSAEQSATAARLKQQLDAYATTNRAHPGLTATQAEVPEDVQERLRSLGYME